MDDHQRGSCFEYMLCVSKVNPDLFIPSEIWKLIFWMMCDDKSSKDGDYISLEHAASSSEIVKTRVENKDVLYWWDNYVSNPGLRKIAPPIICNGQAQDRIIPFTVFDCLAKRTENAGEDSNLRDIVCCVVDHTISNGRLWFPSYSDLLLGIEKNPNIVSIQFEFNDNCIKISSQDFFEFEFEGKTYFTIRDIMPIWLYSLVFTTTIISLECSSECLSLVCLHGFIHENAKIKYEDLRLYYKGCHYAGGAIAIEGSD